MRPLTADRAKGVNEGTVREIKAKWKRRGRHDWLTYSKMRNNTLYLRRFGKRDERISDQGGAVEKGEALKCSWVQVICEKRDLRKVGEVRWRGNGKLTE